MKKFVLVHLRVKDDPNAVLLVHKDRPEYLKGRFNLIGGKLEEGELPTDAAYRELKEETGIDLDDKNFNLSGVLKCRWTDQEHSIYCFYVDVDEQLEIMPQPGETEYFSWYDLQEMLKDPRLMPNLKMTIPLMNSGVKGWVIDDYKESKVGDSHEIKITFNN